ncbi:MAG: hypothetical protein K2J92_05140 [Muribaculaceae bacterium]|nr:hypothetical protein [Muribaculaceae bacterium]
MQPTEVSTIRLPDVSDVRPTNVSTPLSLSPSPSLVPPCSVRELQLTVLSAHPACTCLP